MPGSLTDQISVGVLTSSLPRGAVDTAVAACGKSAKRSGGLLPPHVMVYFAVAMALFSDEDYRGVLTHLAEPLTRWGCWDSAWLAPSSGGITQARQRLGFEPVKAVFEAIAVPVATALTRGGFCAGRRLVSIDGMVFDVPSSKGNDKEFGYPAGGAFPQARVVTLVECGSHVELGAHIGPAVGKGTGERGAARTLLPLLERDMMLLGDRGFYSFKLWCEAADTGADLLWRLGDIMDLPVVRGCGDGSFLTLLFAPRTRPAVRADLLARARAGDDLGGETHRVRVARVVEYEVADRGDSDELICLLTTVLDPDDAPAVILADSYHQRWDHEGANKEIKTQLRGPGKILRSKSPDMVRQEIYGYLIAHYAIMSLICRAATEADIDPDRLKFTDTLRMVRRRIADPAAFSP